VLSFALAKKARDVRVLMATVGRAKQEEKLRINKKR